MQCGRYQLYEYIKVNNLYRCLQEGLILDIEDLQSCLNIAKHYIYSKTLLGPRSTMKNDRSIIRVC